MSVGESVALAAAAALVSRLIALRLHRRWFHQGFIGDSAVHWVIVRTLRRRPRARWIDEYVIAPEPMSYPTAFHRLAALFPLPVLARRPWLPNLVLWVACIAAFGGYTAFAADSLLGLDRTSVVCLALALVLVIPSSAIFLGPAVAYLKLSARLLGRLTTAAAVLLLAVGTATNDVPSLVGAAVAVGFAGISSVFARQAVGFGIPLLALAWWDWRPLAVLAGGVVLAAALGRSRFLHGVRHTWMQWGVYRRLTKSSSFVGGNLSQFVDLEAIRKAVRKRRIWRLILGREPLRAMTMYPEIIVLGVLLASLHRPGSWHWAAPLAVFAGLYVLTSTQRFNHLGEAYRYLEYALFLEVPFALASTLQAWSTWAQVLTVAAVAGWTAFLVGRIVVRGTWLQKWPEHDALGSFLAGLNLRPGDTVFPVSMRVGAEVCARVDGVRSFWWQPGIVATSIYDEFIEEYPYLKRDCRPLFEKYGVTHVVCDKAALARLRWSYDFSDLTVLAEDANYLAYAVTDSSTGMDGLGRPDPANVSAGPSSSRQRR